MVRFVCDEVFDQCAKQKRAEDVDGKSAEGKRTLEPSIDEDRYNVSSATSDGAPSATKNSPISFVLFHGAEGGSAVDASSFVPVFVVMSA